MPIQSQHPQLIALLTRVHTTSNPCSNMCQQTSKKTAKTVATRLFLKLFPPKAERAVLPRWDAASVAKAVAGAKAPAVGCGAAVVPHGAAEEVAEFEAAQWNLEGFFFFPPMESSVAKGVREGKAS